MLAWHVPVFFILTGYLWKPGRTVREELSRRSRTLLVPYAVWLAVIGCLYIGAFFVGTGSLPVEELRNAIYGGAFAVRPFSAFWFVTVLFFAAVLYRCLERLPHFVGWGLAGVGLVGALFAGELMSKTPLGIALAVPCLIFILIGRELPKLQRLIKHQLLVGVLLLAGGLSLVIFNILEPLDIKNGNFGTTGLSVTNAAAISFGLILLANSAYRRLTAAAHRVTTRLATVGFVVVLTHAYVLALLGTQPTGSWSDFAVALIAPWIIGLILVRTPARRWAVG